MVLGSEFVKFFLCYGISKDHLRTFLYEGRGYHKDYDVKDKKLYLVSYSGNMLVEALFVWYKCMIV